MTVYVKSILEELAVEEKSTKLRKNNISTKSCIWHVTGGRVCVPSQFSYSDLYLIRLESDMPPPPLLPVPSFAFFGIRG